MAQILEPMVQPGKAPPPETAAEGGESPPKDAKIVGLANTCLEILGAGRIVICPVRPPAPLNSEWNAGWVVGLALGESHC